MLCALYRFCRFVDEHKERLLEALHNYKYKVAYAKHFSLKPEGGAAKDNYAGELTGYQKGTERRQDR